MWKKTGLMGLILMIGAGVSQAAELKVASIQVQIRGAQTLESLHGRMEELLTEAKREGRKLVVFPELLAYDLIEPGNHESWKRQFESVADHLTSRHFAKVKEWARRFGMAVLGGSFPRRDGEGRILNTAVLALPDGTVHYQDKIFLTPEEQGWGWVPGEELRVFEADYGEAGPVRTAILICYDSEIPAISNLLAQARPELLLIPSMTGDKGLTRVRWAAQARVVEHHAFAAISGAVPSTWNGLAYQGQGALLAPSEQGFRSVLAQGPRNVEGLVSAGMDFAQLRSSRRATGIYPARDQQARRLPIRLIRQH